MPRVIEVRGDRLRIYSRGERLPSETDAPPARVIVEWAGRTGHPTSYGLLGGTAPDLGTGTSIELDYEGARFGESLAGRADHVEFGLPNEYRSGVTGASSTDDFPIKVTVAAHGCFGSSVVAFKLLAHLLSRVVHSAESEPTDDLIAHWWEQGWEQAISASLAAHPEKHDAT